jgi:uncharacterized membrane protein YtjA (UPF0391 family)
MRRRKVRSYGPQPSRNQQPEPFGLLPCPSGTATRANLLSTSRAAAHRQPSKEDDMLYWALVFLVIAIIAAIFGFGGIAATASSIAQILFFIFLVIFVITLIMGLVGRRRPPI